MVETSDTGTMAGGDLDALIRDRVDSMVAAKVDELFAIKEAERARKPKKLAIIATKGTLDWAYPPLILATTGATLGWDVGIFFTFYGLRILQKDRKLEVGTTGNPAMPMPIPMPQLLTALPGMTPMATSMMKRQFKAHGVASIDELLELAVELGVKLSPCGMTMDVFGFLESSFIDGIEPVCGATHFLTWAADADIALFT
ncbi:MAG TPA: DsrE/DsrF/DrsH-like family protein [Candidatus Deferrimicrobium sp.]|nr:DsrE/DsrF/DrsH-like family protein [Candidatus Deferrimicrobium sp.]